MTDQPGAVAAGWLADPTGRHQFRFWDGSVWTDRVSTDGAVASDPPQMPEVDLSVLDEPVLAFGVDAKGRPGQGPWPVLDSSGRQRAVVVIDTPTFGNPRYTMVDSAGARIIHVESASLTSLDHVLLGATGLRIGTYDRRALKQGIELSTPEGVWANVDTTAERIGRWAARMHRARSAVTDSQGGPLGVVMHHLPDLPLDEIEQWPALDPSSGWRIIDRTAGLTDPLRGLVAGAPMVLDYLALVERKMRT